MKRLQVWIASRNQSLTAESTKFMNFSSLNSRYKCWLLCSSRPPPERSGPKENVDVSHVPRIESSVSQRCNRLHGLMPQSHQVVQIHEIQRASQCEQLLCVKYQRRGLRTDCTRWRRGWLQNAWGNMSTHEYWNSEKTCRKRASAEKKENQRKKESMSSCRFEYRYMSSCANARSVPCAEETVVSNRAEIFCDRAPMVQWAAEKGPMSCSRCMLRSIWCKEKACWCSNSECYCHKRGHENRMGNSLPLCNLS
jgi:hypothetical protein